MDQDRARSLLIAERDEVQGLLKDAETAGTSPQETVFISSIRRGTWLACSLRTAAATLAASDRVDRFENRWAIVGYGGRPAGM